MQSLNKIDISSSTIFRIMLILLGFWFVYSILDIVIMLFSAVIIASAIEPVARYLDKYKIHRAISALSIYMIVLLLLAGTVGLMVQPLAIQVKQLATVLPSAVNKLSELLPLIPSINQANLLHSVQSGLLNFSDNIANFGFNVFAGTKSIVNGFINFLFVFVIAFYFILERDALKKFGRLITPRQHHSYIEQAVEKAQRSIGRWVLGQVVLGATVGILVGLGMWAIGVPYALLLGILAAVMEIIPAIGPVIGATVGVLVALSQGWITTLIAFAYYVVIGQIENHILIPNIMKRAVGLPPLITIIAVIIGAKLLGLLGIILAVPAATIIGIFVTDITKIDETEKMSG